ncbi:MAG: alpha/beta fold hydrolase [Melioribacteraceae bacterium]|nr:alpha/beta fold hydrolase [Melioribacteraceae bacterium]
MQKVINSMLVSTVGSKNNQSILFVHGFPFDSWMWNNQTEFLKKDYYCVTYDIRGLGESYVGDGQYTMEAFVEDLISVVRGLNLNKPVLCGLSMGGYISLRTIEKYQEYFSGLILLDTKSEADDDKGKLIRAAKINQVNTEGVEAFVNGFVPGLFAEETIKEKKKLYQQILLRCYQQSPIGVKGALIAMLSRTDTTKFLRKIKIPTLVLSGCEDKLTPPVSMRKMADKIKESEFGIAPRAGHLTPLENPAFINDMIAGFLKRRIKI